MIEKDVARFFHNYSEGNACLAIKTYRQQYGNLSKDAILNNIRSCDARFNVNDPYSDVYRNVARQADDFRIWFVCCEWLTNGMFNPNTCVYYHRKYQDGQQVVDTTTEIAKANKSELFGYPDMGITRRFISWPGTGDEKTLRTIVEQTNRRLHQWSHLPAILSDIRVWPLRQNLLNPGKNEVKNCVPCECR